MDDQTVMDTHTLRLFENIERRSETYGISNALTTPLRERNSVVNATSVPMAVTNYVSGRRLTEQKYQLPVAHTTTTQTTSLNMDSKENVDMAFEINVPSGTDVQVQIEVEDGDGNIISRSPLKRLSIKSSTASVYAIQSALGICSTSIQRAALSASPDYIDNSSHVPTNSAPTSSPSPAKMNGSRKQLRWHQSVIDALESHEFKRPNIHTKNPSPSSATRQLNIGHDRNTSTMTASSKTDVTITKGLVAGRAAIFERRVGNDDTDSSEQQQKDPAELSLKERFALFEKNRGTALIPKAALGMAPSAKQIAKANAPSSGTQRIAEELPNIRDRRINNSLTNSCKDSVELNYSKPSILSEPDQASQCDANLSVLDAIEDVNRVKGDLAKFESNAYSDDVKQAKNDASEYETIYPSLLGIESDDLHETTEPYTETEDDVELLSSQHGNDDTDDDSDDLSEHSSDDSEASSSNGDRTGSDDYLDEALECDDDDDKRNLVTMASVSSNSFSYKKQPSHVPRQSTITEGKPMKSHTITTRLTDNAMDGKNTEHLAYTVKSYRRKQLNIVEPVADKAVCHSNDDLDTSTESEGCDDGSTSALDDHIRSQMEMVDAKIRKLQENAAIQHQQMVQASNALNTCASTFEFSGSTESVVAEWKLLIASHSRQAAQNEVARLRSEGYFRPAGAPTECGRLIVREIIFPLKQDYITKLQNGQILGQHLVCLLKYNEQVVATKTVRTLPNLLSVKFHDVLRVDNVYADFKVTLEIYGMEAQPEVLPHNIKYRIKNKKGFIKTPKGKKAVSRLNVPPLQSPATLNAVRTPSFVRYGFVTFSLREAQRINWTLDLVPDVSNPLFGNVYMKVNYEFSVNINHRGFLTMFDDISGFGAWHRRWCRLHGNNSNNVLLSYWRYPEDERNPPIGSLDLSACEQKLISTAPREVCARPNTMLLELKRPRHEDDQDSLILATKGEHTIVRHLLSTDTKEERNEWIAHFTKALALMRGWDAQR